MDNIKLKKQLVGKIISSDMKVCMYECMYIYFYIYFLIFLFIFYIYYLFILILIPGSQTPFSRKDFRITERRWTSGWTPSAIRHTRNSCLFSAWNYFLLKLKKICSIKIFCKMRKMKRVIKMRTKKNLLLMLIKNKTIN